jgi:hypothetical protein
MGSECWTPKKDFPSVIVESKLEVQANIVRRFAPAGRDVYSLVIVFFGSELRRSATCSGKAIALLAGFAPTGAKILLGAFIAINISLRWSESQFHWCISKLNFRFTNDKW